MSAPRLLAATLVATLLFLLAGLWLYAVAAAWRLLAVSLLALLCWGLAFREHRLFIRERERPGRIRI